MIMTAKPSLRCEGLCVSYGRKHVFRGLDLSLGAGIHALRGPNGIGKSTVLRVLAGAQAWDAGQVWIDGIDLAQPPRQARQRLSYVADEAVAYPFMTGWDLLDFCAWAKRSTIDESVEAAIRDFGLQSHLATRFDAMSLGTARKMAICAGLIGKPAVLLLDEPSNGLDRASVEHLAALLRERAGDTVILLSSHDDDFLQATGAASLFMEDLMAQA